MAEKPLVAMDLDGVGRHPRPQKGLGAAPQLLKGQGKVCRNS
jgi:hypothetical protein